MRKHPLRFAVKQSARIPEHWTKFGRRSSTITGTPRMADNPAGAMLNFLYAVAAAETRLACLAIGLDPGLGFYHVDKRGRDSLVYDIIEPIRPHVDEWLFALMEEQVFTIGDFHETRRGAIRVNPPLSDHLAATGSLWAAHLGPLVERIARQLLPDGEAVSLPNLSHGSRISQNQENLATRVPTVRTPSPRCHTCGTTVGRRNRYCEDCRAQALIDAGKRSAARRLEKGESAKSLRKRSTAMKHRRKDNIKWDRNQGRLDPTFSRPRFSHSLKTFRSRNWSKRQDSASPYCSLIRRGEVAPHGCHWDALLAIGQDVT